MTTSSTSTSQRNAPTPFAAQNYTSAINQAAGLSQSPYNATTGVQVAGLTQPQLNAFGQLQNIQGIQQPYLTSALNYANMGAAPISSQSIQGYLNPFQDQVVKATMAQLGNQQGQQAANLTGNLAASGALGGDRSAVARGILANQQALATGQTLAGLNWRNSAQALAAAQQDAARQMQTAYTVGNLGQEAVGLGIQGAQAGLAAGNQMQQQQQQQLNAATQNAIQQTMWPYQNTQYYAQIAGALGPLLGGTTSSTSEESSPLGSMLGLGTLGYGLLFSDQKVKEGIQPIGKTFDDQTIYKFRYRGDPTPRIGLIAQQVEKKHPEAVKSVGGVKAVDYDLATKDAARPKSMAPGGAVRSFDQGGSIGSYDNPWPDFHLLPFPTAQLSSGSAFPGAASTGAAGQSSNPFSTAQDMYKLGQSIGGEGGLIGSIGSFLGFEQGGRVRGRADGGELDLYSEDTQPPPAGIAPFLLSANPDTPVASSSETGPVPYYGTDTPSYRPSPDVQTSPFYLPNVASSAELPAIQGSPSNPAGISPQTIEFLKAREGFRPNPYGDYKQSSIGYGTKALPTDTAISRQEAEQRLSAKAGTINDWLNQNVTQPLTRNQRTALVDFGFNLGTGPGGLTDLLPAINSGDWQAVGNQMGRYIHAGGKALPGLIARRDMDMSLLTLPDGSPMPAMGSARGAPEPGTGTDSAHGDYPRMMAQADQIMERMGYKQSPDTSTGGLLAKIFGENPLTVDPLGLQGNPIAMAGLGILAPGSQKGLQTAFTRESDRKQAVMKALKTAEIMRHNRATEATARRQALQKTFTRIGTDIYGQPTYGFVDPMTGKVTPFNLTGKGIGPGGEKLTGDAYIKTLEPGYGDIVKKVGDYELSVPKGSALRSIYWQHVMRDALVYNRQFDEKEWKVRSLTRDDFSSKGKSGQNITFINTAMDHVGRLYEEAKKLKNWNKGTFGIFTRTANSWRNWAREQSGDESVKRFEANKHDAIQMMIRAAKGSASLVHEIEEWEKTINKADSPEALKAAIAKGVELMGGRLEALADTYNRNMKTNLEPSSFMSEHTKAIRSNIEREQRESEAGTSTAPENPLPRFDNDDDAMAAIQSGQLKSGDHFIDKNGDDRWVH